MDARAVAATALDEEWSATVDRVRDLIRSQLVPEQLGPFDSASRFEACCSSRQCGKTFMAARLLVDTALRVPESISVYVSDTWDNAVKVMWVDQEDGLPAVLATLGLVERSSASDTLWHYRVNLSTRTVTFRNGSIVELAGADRNAWAKFRGRKLDLIVADEMQRQHQDSLEAALRRDVPDCLMRRRGRFVGLGTVGRALRGLWFEVNAGTHGLCPVRPGWGCSHWTAYELRDRTRVWDEQVAYAAAMGIDTETDPEWLREKRGLWVRDEGGLLHTLSARSLWDGTLPVGVRTRCPEHGHMRGRCACVLPEVPRSEEPVAYAGLDLGFDDPCGVVVGTISREEGVLREVHSEQRGGMDTAQMADWLRDVRERFRVQRFYCDPAWKVTVTDLRSLYGLPVEAALKGDAEGTTEDLWHGERQSALRDGSMLVRSGGVLHGQLESLLRDPVMLEQGHVRAAPGQDDHAADAWRYLFRMVRTRHVVSPTPPASEAQRLASEARDMRERSLRPPPVMNRREAIRRGIR
jgi:hypothetical protein